MKEEAFQFFNGHLLLLQVSDFLSPGELAAAVVHYSTQDASAASTSCNPKDPDLQTKPSIGWDFIFSNLLSSYPLNE